MEEKRKHQRVYLNATAILSQNNISSDRNINRLHLKTSGVSVNKARSVKFHSPPLIKNNTNPPVKGKIINASLNGLGLQLSCLKKRILSYKDPLRILIKLPDNQGPIHKSGRIIWYKRSSFFNYRVGVELK